MAIKDSYPAIRPSLDLNFAGSGMVDPRITFTRASSATYFDEKGVMRTAPAGVPRIDHDPVTGECKGLLIEEQRTNLLTYSEQFDNAAWLKALATVVPSNELAPNGVIGAKLLQETTSTGVHSIEQPAASVPINSKIALSVFVKPSGRTKIRINSGRAANVADSGLSQFGLVGAGVVEFSQNQLASIINLGGGWYRCSVIAETNSIVVDRFITISLVNDSGTNTYAGDGTSGIYIWGAQLEVGAFPTSYIKTEASQVTRAADNASMLGENFSSWYRQDEGTFVVGWGRNYTFTGAEGGGTPRVFTISDDALTTLLNLSGNASGGVSELFGGSGTAANLFLTSTVVPANTPTTFACAYKENDCAMVRDGGGSAIDTSYVPATSFTRLYLGNRQSIDRPLNGHISRLAYYPRRLAKEQLQALTA